MTKKAEALAQRVFDVCDGYDAEDVLIVAANLARIVITGSPSKKLRNRFLLSEIRIRLALPDIDCSVLDQLKPVTDLISGTPDKAIRNTRILAQIKALANLATGRR
jgi:hypothetical protein